MMNKASVTSLCARQLICPNCRIGVRNIYARERKPGRHFAANCPRCKAAVRQAIAELPPPAPQGDGTYRSGNARCLNCKHEWVATAPSGTTSLECPSCGTHQGLFKGIAHTEYRQWQCTCSEWSFFIDEQGPYCAHCGARPRF